MLAQHRRDTSPADIEELFDEDFYLKLVTDGVPHGVAPATVPLRPTRKRGLIKLAVRADHAASVLLLAQKGPAAGVSVRRLPQGAIASPLNHPEHREDCAQHQYPGHKYGPGAKAPKEGGNHDGCRDRADAECHEDREHDDPRRVPRGVGHAVVSHEHRMPRARVARRGGCRVKVLAVAGGGGER